MNFLRTCFLVATVLFSGVASADSNHIDGYDVMADSLVVRPLSFLGTVAGSLIFAASSPFIAIANIHEPQQAFELASETLVFEPARYTFERTAGDFEFPEKVQPVYTYDIR